MCYLLSRIVCELALAVCIHHVTLRVALKALFWIMVQYCLPRIGVVEVWHGVISALSSADNLRCTFRMSY